ncbi:hypothetical protein GGTG_07570 [Gaeumannomyces tritici R3-111a-1]|uniref:Uncharacterized protein n=1 Tax=Gaeumannomyces tritici (strain R3-111a-1) TaxID=644352 RepID=J3P222_GAET3|nr:hypothetical protein GGTG_07570 [Gaeumannomyces tritici R3-111a-1]EJT73714.1 hypothetical protein GGTG_07570 [Gaeumannomyces tritici R3-111a-1]
MFQNREPTRRQYKIKLEFLHFISLTGTAKATLSREHKYCVDDEPMRPRVVRSPDPAPDTSKKIVKANFKGSRFKKVKAADSSSAPGSLLVVGLAFGCSDLLFTLLALDILMECCFFYFEVDTTKRGHLPILEPGVSLAAERPFAMQ